MLETGIYPPGRTNPLRAQYIEVWATNAAGFTNTIRQAHQELFTPPWNDGAVVRFAMVGTPRCGVTVRVQRTEPEPP